LTTPGAPAYASPMSTRAAIDIGSNSVRLLIVNEQGAELCREMHITRLAEGVDKTGELAESAMQRTQRVLERYAEFLSRERVKVQRLRVTGTSAARDARNRSVFFERVQQAVGSAPELLSGEQEAALAFAGATHGRDAAAGPFVTLDIGGGSTEFAFGQAAPESSISLNVGCVRMTERFFFANDPPSPAELAAARDFLHTEFARVDRAVPVRKARTWLGLAGTVTSLAARDAGLTQYDPTVTDGYVLTRERVLALHEELCALPQAERAQRLLEPQRAGVILGGSIVLVEVLRYFDLPQIVVSERDILDGLVASIGDS
jgi:exopolyphosphatase / guanosine-5'-triphosphate,3'-diphosphate pyrophosphatase